VAYRRAEERSNNPERLNLDRRQLTSCPILENEFRLRLLNYQNNYISEIKNIFNLPNLIFLDLYNNCIEEINDSLSCVPTLRVLMLGKNRIKTIHNIDSLYKLDVLDLHSNHVSKVSAAAGSHPHASPPTPDGLAELAAGEPEHTHRASSAQPRREPDQVAIAHVATAL
jgi:Leucine-rich repeat (LRR) protein